MRYGVLGPLAVWDAAGDPVRVPEAKVRALLAALLVQEGRVASADRLVDELWGDEPPGNPANALQAKVSQLRRAIGRDRVPRQGAGYRLALDAADGGQADEVDAARFLALVADARAVTDPAERAARLETALGLWRGPAYADFADEEFARAAAHRLDEQRVAVLEEHAEARLEAGGDPLLTGELADLVARYPLRERLRAVQLRALYLAGRQSEALASYADLRGRLAEELGLDPSPDLAALYEAILRQDPSLDARPRRTEGVAGAVRPQEPSRTPATDLGHAPGPAAGTAPPAEPDTVPGGGAPRTVPSNLPADLTPLIGREAVLARVVRLLDDARLVTLTGPGGVGKTRLAIAAARCLTAPSRPTTDGPRWPRTSADTLAAGSEAATPDGRPPGAAEPAPPTSSWLPDSVRFVELAGRHGDAAELAGEVAAVLGIRDDTPAGAPRPTIPAAPAERLVQALGDRSVLLVLDNCEHVVDAAAELAALLLRAAPGVRILATSQEPLAVAGEAVVLIEPLETAEAQELFMARAAAAAPGFAPSGDGADLDAVVEVCERLDGIPLALELAATRVRALGVRGLADRLGDRFGLLTSGRRDAPARQRTLRAVIDWSWELLGAPERIVLRRLAVHRDGCTLEAAEAVCAGDGVDAADVLDLLTRLVERSLVVVVTGPTGTRYRLLETVAAYALDRLHEMADAADTRRRHLRYYQALAEDAEAELRGADQRRRLALLDAEAANLRAALDEALDRDEADDAARFTASLCWWWLLRGRLTEARRRLEAALRAAPDDPELVLLHQAFARMTGAPAASVQGTADRVPDPARRGRALWLCAYGEFSASDMAASAELNDAAVALFEAAGDGWGVAAGLALRAMHGLFTGDLAALHRDGVRAAAAFQALGDRWGELQTVSPLAAHAQIMGDYAEAECRQRQGLALAEELGLHAEVSARLSGLGRLALLAADWPRAAELHERARRLAVEQGYRFGEAAAETGLALGARRSGALDEAEARLLSMLARFVSPAGDHLRHAELGFTAEMRGDRGAALAHHLRGLEHAFDLAEPRAFALSLEGLAGAESLAAGSEGPTRAAVLLGAADAARRGVGAPLPTAERADVDRITARTTAALGEEAFAEAFARGAGLAPEEAAGLARTPTADPQPSRSSATADS
ncbi:AfsR/SARP family transcriptional regulator [Streptomyces palmae]|uniref:AfsR/SARP family transcriptional regulator n=1 Tax=Streptomyces palmae TaxID=1701085 RepID=A0A4Z0GD37_9ACTN|nr:BTAD domain-containing putative transcriptional regulator [Streptomyces palmae]TGA93203.1 AfsR/SARP family transcriptional regulator [Streptomyces palmae]